MGLIFPTNADEVSRSGWLLVAFFLAPIVLPFVFWWQIHVSFDAFMKVWPAAVPAGFFLGWMLHRRSLRLVALGLHTRFRPSQRVPRRNALALFALVVPVTWAWAVALLALAVLLTTESEERPFTVSEVTACTRRCLGCPTQIEFSDWAGASRARFCADSLQPRPRVGERLSVRGKFNDLVQYVRAPERVRGRS